jgi:chromosomal replication initiator protein
MQNSVWQSILSDCSDSFSKGVVDTWFRPLVLLKNSDSSCFTISAPNQFVCDFIEQHYKKPLLSIIRKYSPTINDIVFITPHEGNIDYSPETGPFQSPSTENKIILNDSSSFVFNRNFSFDSFVTGPGNEFAKSAALAVAQAPGKTKFNPLLIYSGVGLEKHIYSMR